MRVRRITLEGSLLATSMLVVLVLILYPLLMLLRRSLSVAANSDAWTFQWYVQAYTDPKLTVTIVDTFLVLAGSMGIAFALGVSMAFLVGRTDVPFFSKAKIIPVLPFLTPPFIMAIGWMLLAAPRSGLLNGWIRALTSSDAEQGPFNIFTMPGLIWVMALYLTPYIYLLTLSGLKNLDPTFEEASRLAGANVWKTLRKVTLPLVTPALLSGLLLAFIMGLGQFGIPAALGVPSNIQVVSTSIWQNIANWPARTELAAALATSLLGLALLGLYAQRRIQGQRSYATVTGKGFRPGITRLGRWGWSASAFCWLYVFATVVLPYYALLQTSFSTFWTPKLTPSLFTLDNYRYVLFQYPSTPISIRNSLLLSIGGATLGILLAAICSWIVHRTETKGRHLLDYILMLPIGIPATVLAVGLLAAWIQPPLVLYGSLWILLVAYITIYLPFGVRSTSSSLQQVSKELEEASRVAGGSWLRTFRRITLPLIRPGLITGWFLLFVMFMRELSASILLYVPQTTVISVALFDLLLEANYPRLAALGTVIVLISIGSVAILHWLTRGAYTAHDTVQ